MLGAYTRHMWFYNACNVTRKNIFPLLRCKYMNLFLHSSLNHHLIVF